MLLKKLSRSSSRLLKRRGSEKRNVLNVKKRKEEHRQSGEDWKPRGSSEKRQKRRGRRGRSENDWSRRSERRWSSKGLRGLLTPRRL